MVADVGSSGTKNFIVRHTPCVHKMGRGGKNLSSAAEKARVNQLWRKERRLDEDLDLSQCDEPLPIKRRIYKSKSFVEDDSSDDVSLSFIVNNIMQF